MISWHLSNQAIRWPVPRDNIAGSILLLVVVVCFIKVDRSPKAGFFPLDRGSMPVKIIENRAGLFASLLTLIQV